MESGQLIIQTLQIHVWHFPFCVAPIKLTLKGITSQDTEALFHANASNVSNVCYKCSWLVKRNFMEEHMQTKKMISTGGHYLNLSGKHARSFLPEHD